jgi:lipopolysaccharide transport system ATP-binding protein
MTPIAIKLENLSKQYKLGTFGTGTISHDLNRYFARIMGKEDPASKITAKNDLNGASDMLVWALRDINLEVKQGEVLGLVGKNGAGKSTLLKLLSRVTSPTTGTIKINGRLASLLEVGTGFHPELTGKENIYLNGAILGMTKKEITRKFDEIVEFSGVKKYIDTPVKRYSSGMYVRLAFAVAAHLEPEILVVDEVLAVGDAEFQKKALGKMQSVSRSGRTVLFVSHNLNAVEQLCTSAVLIQQGTVKMHGAVPDIISAYKQSILGQEEIRRYGTSQVEFLKYRTNNSSGTKCNEFCLGEDIEIMARLRFNEDVDLTDLSIDIRNEANEFISHVTNMDDSFHLQKHLKGDEREVRITVKNFSLAPGTYQLSLWLGNNYGTFDYHENCMTVNIKQGDQFIRRIHPFDRRSKAVLQSEWRLTS